MDTPKRVLLIFAKEPGEGTAKTRLAPRLDAAEREAFYRAMLEDLAATVERVACDRRVLYHTPDRTPRHLRAIFRGIELRPQSGAHLGERMERALAATLEEGEVSTSAVLIGSDAPLLGADEIDAAFDALEDAEIVLLPSIDGGYCLIGVGTAVRPYLPSLFDGIPWSGPSVFETTLDRIGALIDREPRFRFALLPTLYDVDTPEDLDRLRVDLRARRLAGLSLPERTAAFLAARFDG